MQRQRQGFYPQQMRSLIAALGFLLMAMNGCDAIYFENEKVAQQLHQDSHKEFRVLTLKHPLIYQKGSHGSYSGIDYDLLQDFAQFSGLTLVFLVRPDEASLMESLSRGEGDIVAARLRGENKAIEGFLVGPAYEETQISLFCRQNLKVAHIKDLEGKSVGLLEKDTDSQMEDRLHFLAPKMSLQKIVNSNAHQLLKLTSKGSLDCAFAEDLEGSYFLRAFPDLSKVTSVTDRYSLNWILRPGQADLQNSMEQWFQQASRQDQILRIQDRYRTFLTSLDIHDIKRFKRSLQQTLPEYEYSFKEAARFYKIDWRLLGAIAFQESQWQPSARSYTGVRGLMQLTEDTASLAGLTDRSDPTESIWGGAFYFKYLWGRIPNNIHPSDHLALTLAAYNMGYGHLIDAQKLVTSKGRNPYSWRDIKSVLPFLSDPDYADGLEHGPARGFETLDFVERVRGFHNIWTYLVTSSGH